MVSALHWHESHIDIYICFLLLTLSPTSHPHPISAGCYSKSPLVSVWHMVIYVSHTSLSIHPILSFCVHNLFSESASHCAAHILKGPFSPGHCISLQGTWGRKHGPTLTGILVQVGRQFRYGRSGKQPRRLFHMGRVGTVPGGAEGRDGRGGRPIWLSFRGSERLRYHSPLCLGAEEDSGEAVLGEKWFIRIGHL